MKTSTSPAQLHSTILRNPKGVLTLDFLFSLWMVMGLTSLFIAMTLMLTVVEVIQYMTFSAAHMYSTAHFSETHQREAAERKFQQLKSSPAIAPLISNGWFSVSAPSIGDFNQEYPASQDKDSFWGVRVKFSAPVMHMTIPFLGSSSDDEGEGFTAIIQSFIIREPTSSECQEFNGQRWQAIRNLSGGFNNPMIPSSANAVAVADNGC
jgi:hypothetical protein